LYTWVFMFLLGSYASCLYSWDMVGYLNNDIPALLHIFG
jgi:hypothetical protein